MKINKEKIEKSCISESILRRKVVCGEDVKDILFECSHMKDGDR